MATGDPMDYFDAKQAVRRLEATINKHIIRPTDDSALPERGVKSAGSILWGAEALSPTDPGFNAEKKQESLSSFVLRRRSELEKQQEELAFLQDVAELMRKHPGYFK